MDEATEAQKVLSGLLKVKINSSDMSEESVVLAPDELDPALVAPAMIPETLPAWLICDFYAVDHQHHSVVVYFLRPSEGEQAAFIEGVIRDNQEVLWVKMLD